MVLDGVGNQPLLGVWGGALGYYHQQRFGQDQRRGLNRLKPVQSLGSNDTIEPILTIKSQNLPVYSHSNDHALLHQLLQQTIALAWACHQLPLRCHRKPQNWALNLRMGLSIMDYHSEFVQIGMVRTDKSITGWVTIIIGFLICYEL